MGKRRKNSRGTCRTRPLSTHYPTATSIRKKKSKMVYKTPSELGTKNSEKWSQKTALLEAIEVGALPQESWLPRSTFSSLTLETPGRFWCETTKLSLRRSTTSRL